MTEKYIEYILQMIIEKTRDYNEKYKDHRKITTKGLCEMYGVNKGTLRKHRIGEYGGILRKKTEEGLKIIEKSTLAQIHKKRFG